MAHIQIDLITIVEFKVFDRGDGLSEWVEKPFYNCTPEQCCKFIWDKIWETAIIRKITEYNIHEDGIHSIDVTPIKNKLNHSKAK